MYQFSRKVARSLWSGGMRDAKQCDWLVLCVRCFLAARQMRFSSRIRGANYNRIRYFAVGRVCACWGGSMVGPRVQRTMISFQWAKFHILFVHNLKLIIETTINTHSKSFCLKLVANSKPINKCAIVVVKRRRVYVSINLIVVVD